MRLTKVGIGLWILTAVLFSTAPLLGPSLGGCFVILGIFSVISAVAVLLIALLTGD